MAKETIVWFNWKDRSNPLAGGAEVVNEELAKRLVADGHSVTFIVSGFPGAPATDTRDGFKIIRVGSRPTVYWAAWRYYRAHKHELMPTLVIDETNTMPFFAGWYSGVRTIHFFHMLCREIWFYELPKPLAAIGWLAEPIYLRLLKRAPVITISESTRQDLIRQGFKAKDIHIISEGIELTPVENLDAVTKYPEPTVLSLGAMRSMKRTLDQIEAFDLAKATVPNLKLKVAGDSTGTYGSKVLARIATSKYHADIEVLGRVTPETKLELMQKSHAILVTSVKEGWGLIVTEAASQGTPAIVYNVDGLRDSVRDNVTGLVVRPATPAAMAAKIVELLQNPKEYERLRRQTRDWSREITFERSYSDFKEALGL